MNRTSIIRGARCALGALLRVIMMLDLKRLNGIMEPDLAEFDCLSDVVK